MKEQTKADIIVWTGVILALLAIGGGAAYLTLNKPPSVCATETVALPPPLTQPLLLNAIDLLIEEGAVPSRDLALEALTGVNYVFDPTEDSELEYWLIFPGVVAEFNFKCPLDEENYPLGIEFERVRGL